jgi:two-component system, sensor histidine kinase and response regulator
MNAVLGMLQLLHSTRLSPQQLDYADKTEGAARSLLGLLNDILDFSKVEAGKMQLDAEPFSLNRLLDELSTILSSNLGGKNVDLLFDVDPDIPATLVGDALRIKQVLINLGGNAVKFTAHGHVLVRLRMLARHTDRVRMEISVVDSGIGIAPENQARIFDAFTQAESNTTRRFGGTGLGLVISKRLIRLMGGELELTSALVRAVSSALCWSFRYRRML